MDERENKVLILGIGNDIQQDVGIPVRLARDMKDLVPSGTFDFECLFIGGLELLEYINGYQGVVFIDTMKTEEHKAGRVHVFTTGDYQETLHLSCRHDVSFKMSLEMGRKLGFIIPEKILIIGIEILEDLEFGATLSDDMKHRYSGIQAEVKNLVMNFGRSIVIRSTDQNNDQN
jgi:hydrogenase maturation protease